jgi:hypothetical protein
MHFSNQASSLRRLTFSVPIVLLLFALLAVVVNGIYGEMRSPAVGVKVGDWVKYKVTNSGADIFRWPGTEENALWMKDEVIDIAYSTVTVRETVHYVDGNEWSSESSWNLENDFVNGHLKACNHFIIAANHSAGDKIGELAVCLDNNTYATYVDVILNDTEFRSFGEITKEVNHLNFSFVIPEDPFGRNDTLEIYWEKQSGFMVKAKMQTHHIGYDDYSTSILEIEDTNMWTMGGTHPTWGEVGAAIIIPGSLIVGYIGIRSRNHRKKHEESS